MNKNKKPKALESNSKGITPEQFAEKIRALLDDNKLGFRDQIYNACIAAMSSEYAKDKFMRSADNNYILPKTVLCAVLQRIAWQYEPHGKERKNVDLIKPLIYNL